MTWEVGLVSGLDGTGASLSRHEGTVGIIDLPAALSWMQTIGRSSDQGGERFRLWTLIQGKRAGAGNDHRKRRSH
ncbi:hypothetical protein MINT15_08930 [Saccharomonospora viridis]|uniref:Uncharacterized protein n=1 Tax=Saccharomonospora viridis TaxID=1852 RepID=A0A837DIH6_9PSEU|nr:hypothetical protein MINT15_08930 [Saccharomonospora viridis]